MNTEISEHDAVRAAGWIFYDAACSPCVRSRNRTKRLFESRGFRWLPLQTPGAAERLGVPASDFKFRLHLLTPDGRVLHNADALGVLCRSVWWLWPVGIAMRVPGLRELARGLYDWVARNRYWIGGTCPVNPEARGGLTMVDWALALFASVFAGAVSWGQPAWVLMWALALGLALGLKWLTWREAVSQSACPSPGMAFAWFTLWPGMDSHTFFNSRPSPRADLREWVWASAMTMLGISLIWLIVPPLMPEHPMIAAWAGMSGIVVTLHFGVIRVLSIILRSVGVNALPIMNAPLRATSLAEFWGTRWNAAFSIPARRLVLRPLARKVGLPMAGFLVFLCSGLLHEVVISLPAGAGFGLPTLYFVLQGMGVAFERSRAGRGLGLGCGVKGRLFSALFTIGPVYWLFHPPFAQEVVVPFLKTLNNL